MKSVSALHYALLLTVIIIGITLFYPNNQLYLVSTIVVSVIWLIAFYKSQSDLKQHGVVVERVEELKKFSIELQSLVDKELVLVQEDVIRIKEIVGDSIGILQNSTHSININMQSQKQYIEHIISKLDVKDAKKIAAFMVVSENKKGSESSSETIESNVVNLHSMGSFDVKNKENIENMMLALQFEDIVSQITERLAEHVGDIRSTVDILSRLCESELSTTFKSDIDDMKLEYSIIKEKLLQVSTKNLAAQKNMDEGDVELF